MSSPDDFAPLAIMSRSGFDESVHFGAAVGLDRSGNIAVAVGDPAAVIFPRSSNKPLQALAMVQAGLDLSPEMLALVCASHDGTPRHTAIVERILAGAGLDTGTLANVEMLPLEEASATAILRSGGGPSRLTMNCSGKHAGMLATCRLRGWPTDASYLSPDHPLQRAITRTMADVIGTPSAHIGVDGCGAPVHAMPLRSLAEAFRVIATGGAGLAGDAVATAMSSHPELVGGERRTVTRLMRAVPGLVAKDGADGVFAGAMPDGRAFAVKISDGAERAVASVVVRLMRALGIDVPDEQWEAQVLGHGRPVGSVRAVAP